MKPESFTLKTIKNQLIQINYASVQAIGIARYSFEPSRSETVGRRIEHWLFLPFTILQCLLFGCGS
jgi:hypothetical protein